MVIYNKIEISSKTTIYIAYFDQNLELSTNLLTDKERERYSKITAKRRAAEYLLARALVCELFPGDTIVYGAKGAPSLESGDVCISISHSSKALALMVSDGDCGVDIEVADRNFALASGRFLTSHDITSSDNRELGAIWCAKEAIYKFFGGKYVRYEDAIVKSISDNSIICMVLDKLIEAKIINFREHIILYCDKFQLD